MKSPFSNKQNQDDQSIPDPSDLKKAFQESENEKAASQIQEDSDSLQVRVICTSLNVRKKPTKESEVLFKVKKDDLLILLENTNTPDDWIHMSFNEKSGWVMKEFTEEV